MSCLGPDLSVSVDRCWFFYLQCQAPGVGRTRFEPVRGPPCFFLVERRPCVETYPLLFFSSFCLFAMDVMNALLLFPCYPRNRCRVSLSDMSLCVCLYVSLLLIASAGVDQLAGPPAGIEPLSVTAPAGGARGFVMSTEVCFVVLWQLHEGVDGGNRLSLSFLLRNRILAASGSVDTLVQGIIGQQKVSPADVA
ncbi:hypothetical protein B0T25DRAFT_177684 [Lasiosphaeria hispida]|uniref:Uncharacterized protein n=1 Tax=Lasiosphaeria hispida TaxID=260671 RepID=A0AAJ0MGY7_9PEZI|nr:hypothetical protein B0T25DRAFT_177684 [Lasiosphaeria hispida]